FEQKSLSEPFFRQSVMKASNDPTIQRKRTTRSHLKQYSGKSEPAGMIFHIGRCGSTLIANAMRVFADTTVISEPEIINHILAEENNDLLAAAISAFCQKRAAKSGPTFLKLTSWNLFYADRFRQIWPDVPSVFVIRS